MYKTLAVAEPLITPNYIKQEHIKTNLPHLEANSLVCPQLLNNFSESQTVTSSQADPVSLLQMLTKRLTNFHLQAQTVNSDGRYIDTYE